MTTRRPKYITFDCYGTLIDFRVAPAARIIFADRIPGERMDAFCADFAAFRLDEVLGAWKPYPDVIADALARSCAAWKLRFEPSDAARLYAAIPDWPPHPDVPDALARIATAYPLVILSNSMTDLIPHSVAKLGAPFHAVFTAEEAGAYKPRMRAFEYMLDSLGCGPEDIFHCSSSFRYDLMTAQDMHIANKAFVNRGHEPPHPSYGSHEIRDIGELPSLLGI
ncbi:haloacid dehalogenase type II [Chelatococcus sp. GCM10030263]|uniref:haloacid dehalogenase type II n=1 Tax=Chelatococcus sp. GCM10030263 TaxID=3273387 RepID=UPI0036069A8B